MTLPTIIPALRYTFFRGADHGFGRDVLARLETDDISIVEDLAELPAHSALDSAIIDLTSNAEGAPFRTVTDDDLRALLDDQLYAFVAAVQLTVPCMSSNGAIVQIIPKTYLGSWGGVHGAASAAACVAMARSMAIEFAPLGIRVNSVATGRPGDAWDTPSARADIAATVAWLAGPDSAQITGETILADRGASLRMAQADRR